MQTVQLQYNIINMSFEMCCVCAGVVLRECTCKDPPYFTETVFRAMYKISTNGIPPLPKKKHGSASWSKELVRIY